MPISLPLLVLLSGCSAASRYASAGDKGGSLTPIEVHEAPNDRVPTNDGSDPLVAVCIVGLVRNFVDPIVYKNLKHNFLDSISNKTFAFAVLKEYSDPLSSIQNAVKRDNKSLEKALNYVKPIRSIIYKKEEDDFVLGNYSCHYDYNSVPSNLTGVRMNWKTDMHRPGHPTYTKSFGQMKGAWDCIQQIKEVEKKHRVKFDGIFRIRTDNVWVRSPFPAKDLVKYAKKKKAILHDWDMVLFAPRKGMNYFSKFYDEWLKCKGSWPGRSVPELEWEDGAKALGYYYQDFPFPQIIKRPDICAGSPMQHCFHNSADLKFGACVHALYKDEIPNGLNIAKAEKYWNMIERCGYPGEMDSSTAVWRGCPANKAAYDKLVRGFLPAKCFRKGQTKTLSYGFKGSLFSASHMHRRSGLLF